MLCQTKVFNGCRIPGLKTDTICHDWDSSHIIVVHNNQVCIKQNSLYKACSHKFPRKFFKVVVYGENGQILDEGDVLNGLTHVTQSSSRPSAGVGFLTTECRNVWGIAHEELKKGMSFDFVAATAKFYIYKF